MGFRHHRGLGNNRDRDGVACFSAWTTTFMDGDEPRRLAAENIFVNSSAFSYPLVLDYIDRLYGRNSSTFYESLGGYRSVGDRNLIRVYDRLRRCAGQG